MEVLPLTRAYLESLANSELLKIADNLGIDVSQNQDRFLLIEELLDVSSLDSDESDTPPEEETTDLVFVESVPLPKYYNVTFIEIIIRDPFWAFAFWEIKASDKEQLEKALDFNGYYLRVNLLKGADASAREEVLTVQVTPNDTAWYLGFAPNIENETLDADGNLNKLDNDRDKIGQQRYKVELCASIGETETVLAASAPIRMPSLPELPNRKGEKDPELGENRLVCLSGYGDFHVLRRNERPLRVKRLVQSEK